MDEGSSESIQNVDRVMSQGDDSIPITVSSKGITLKNDAVMDNALIQTAFIEISPATDGKTMEQDANMFIDKDSAKDTDLVSRMDEVEPTAEPSSQQIEANKIDDQMTVNVEDTADKNAEVEIDILEGKHDYDEEFPKEKDIQEDELVKVVLEAFEARHLTKRRPIPVLVKGKEVDLVQLSFQVRACGGYDQVTLWSSISKSLGFGQDCGPLLKLVYVKYLKSIENRRLIASQGVQGTQNVSNREHEISGKKDAIKNQSKNRGITSTRKTGAAEGSSMDNTGADISVVYVNDGSESLAQVLEWMKRLALNPGDPRKGQGARVSRWSEAWAGKCETLAARLRDVLWKKHEQSVDNFPPVQSQDAELERKRKKRGRIKGSGKKTRHASS